MKTYAWSFGCAIVFVIAGTLSATGALWNVGHVFWSATEGLKAVPFPSVMCRGLAGGAGLLLLGAGFAGLVMTWREYRWERDCRANSVWKRFCRVDT